LRDSVTDITRASAYVANPAFLAKVVLLLAGRWIGHLS
jgi:hypothetical protein